MLKDDNVKYSKKFKGASKEEPAAEIQNEVTEAPVESDEVKEIVPKEEPAKKKEPERKPVTVHVAISDLNIRKGPGRQYDRTGVFTGVGDFEITDVQKGEGAEAGWGKLADGRGWISLDFAKFI